MAGSFELHLSKEDHPRIRGENPISTSRRAQSLGSPPHTRGKSGTRAGAFLYTRITPAYAGKIPDLVAAYIQDEDHPRIRGENFDEFHPMRTQVGSPPHTRGKFVFVLHLKPQTRITPAYAGKITGKCRKDPAGQDHPRIRGENAYHRAKKAQQRGSPPHTRGKCIFCSHPLSKIGITPAYAGKICTSLQL